MADPLANYIRRGYPKEGFNANGYQTIIEYVGPRANLYGQINLGEPWGDYRGVVDDLYGDPLPGTTDDYVILVCRVLAKFGDEQSPADVLGEEQETTYEIDTVDVTKDLIDHPEFLENGIHELSISDKIAIEKWREMPIPEFREAYLYYDGDIRSIDANELTSSQLTELADNAKVYAKGVLLNVENWIAKAPLLRKSTIYKNGLPPAPEKIGEKDTPISFPGVPQGYEYIKEADRALNNGKQNEWRHDQEWLGADKVLIDSKKIYWEV